MAAPHPSLPRGTRVKVGVKGSLEKILFGPTSLTNGTQNLVGAIEICMGMVGAYNIQEMHNAQMVLAPSIKTEGKHFQRGGS
jgi:IMP dehydrogenase